MHRLTADFSSGFDSIVIRPVLYFLFNGLEGLLDLVRTCAERWRRHRGRRTKKERGRGTRTPAAKIAVV